MGKIIIEKKTSKTALINLLNSIRTGRPHRNVADLRDAKIGGLIKNEFRFQKDRNLINRYNTLINVADDLLFQLIRRVKLD